LEAHRQATEDLESALQEIESALSDDGEALERVGDREGLQLLSIAEVCRTLGMGKSWTSQRLKSGEIPSVKLGRSINVKRKDLQEYVERHRYCPTDAQ
jgi:excisionase family DNA binding protein